MEINIDGKKAERRRNFLYRGPGMVSGNNSSRLLLDYKAVSPESYWKILELLFTDRGLALNHLKIEMGSDANSTSGTEPCVMRSADEEPDLTRGAGFILAADAKKLNPQLTLDMLWWSEPAWVSASEDVFAARWLWYRKILEAAWRKFGLEFDFVSANRNERALEPEWIIYLSDRLKSCPDAPYNFSRIKVVAADEDCAWNIAWQMTDNPRLRDAVDIIGSHYTSWSSDMARNLAEKYGKELWFSEGSPAMKFTAGAFRFEPESSAFAGRNGILDIAARFMTAWYGGKMTMYQFQPAVAAYYDGVCFCRKQLISAASPWSGHFELDPSFFMMLHFSKFIRKGWSFVDGACFADGKPGPDGHSVDDTESCFVTLADPELENFSTVLINPSPSPRPAVFDVAGISGAGRGVNVFVTCGNGPERDYSGNYFRKTDSFVPENTAGRCSFTVTLPPFSVVTVSTLSAEFSVGMEIPHDSVMSLPYNDDFSYADFGADFLAGRGNAPLFTTDQGGAFEVEHSADGNVLAQKITDDMRPKEWGYTPEPVTCFGDDRWFNCSFSAQVKFADCGDGAYAGIGIRYVLAADAKSGYALLVHADGRWEFLADGQTVLDGKAEFPAAGSSSWITLGISAEDSVVRLELDGTVLAEKDMSGLKFRGGGRCALYSSYHRNLFRRLSVKPTSRGGGFSVIRKDDTDFCFSYEGPWRHDCMSSFKNYMRTVSSGSEGARLFLDFDGTGFLIFGGSEEEPLVEISVDGKLVCPEFTVKKTSGREISCPVMNLERGHHRAEIRVLSGEFRVDGVDICYN